MKRRNFVRLIIAAVVGTIVVVEGGTVLELVRRELLGEESGDTDDAGDEDRVGVGDEFLHGTPQTETLVDGVVVAGEGGWTVRLTVEVRNPTEEPSTLRLGELTTGAGSTAEGGYTVEVPAGETGSVTGEWRVREGEVPRWLEVEATYGGTTERRSVELGGIPVTAE